MFQGTGTAIITPFDNELNVDYKSLKQFVKFQIDEGVNAIVVLGTTGEAPTISDYERKKIIAAVAEEVDEKIPIIVGTGTNDTKAVVNFNRGAEDFGVSGLLIVNPYYNKGTQKSLIEHYRFIAERTDLPILLYNVPSRTGMNLLPETALEINRYCSNVIGIKEASGDISQIAKYFSLKPDNFLVYSGNDDQAFPIISMGGSGVVSVLSNVYPKLMSDLTSALLNNNYDEARILNFKYLKLMNLLFAETNPIPVKYAVSKLSYCKNNLRLPLSPASQKTMKLIDEEMEAVKVEYV